MPPRSIVVVIVLAWTIGFASLVMRDLLPLLIVTSPPNFQALVQANRDQDDQPSTWLLLLPDSEGVLTTVGRASNEQKSREDGGVTMTTQVLIDSAEPLKRTPLDLGFDLALNIVSTLQIDPSGQLEPLEVNVRAEELDQSFLELLGRVEEERLILQTKSLAPALNKNPFSIPYQRRDLVQSSFGTLEYMPADLLQVGQRWESQVVSPLTGGVQKVQVEVVEKSLIQWHDEQVMAYQVVSSMRPFEVMTWVRVEDGLVLQQEIPTPFLKLTLQREKPLAEAPQEDRP